MSYTGYTGKATKNGSDILLMISIIHDLRRTGFGDKPSKRKTFFTTKLPKLIDENQNRTFDEITDSDDLQGEGLKLSLQT